MQNGQSRRLGWAILTIILYVVKCEDRTNWRSCRMEGLIFRTLDFQTYF